MTYASTAVCTEEKTGRNHPYFEISTNEIEINMNYIDMIEDEVPSMTIDSNQDECYWCPPPPQAYRHEKFEIQAIDIEEVFLQRQQASRHIKNYKAAVGREIVTKEPGKWLCGQDGLRECAAKIAEFLRQPSMFE
jgi:hypothetical protein